MTKRGAARKAKAALAAVNEDTESDRVLKGEDRSGSDFSFEGSSSGSEEESEVESKRARRAISEKEYEFSSSSSSDSSSAEERASAMNQCNKRSRLVRPTKEICDSSSSDELSAFRISSDEEEIVPEKKQQRRKKANPLVSRQKESNVQELSWSSSDAENGVDEEQSRKMNTAPLGIKRTMKSLSASNTIKIAGSSSSSSGEGSELEEKVPPKKLAMRSENKQVHLYESSSSSSSDDDSALEQKSLQRKKPGLVKSRKTTTGLKQLSKFEHSSSSGSSSEEDAEVEEKRPQMKRSPSVSDSSDFEELSSSSSGEGNEEKQNMNDPLNIEPKMYDNEPESDSSNGGSASETDSEVAWQPRETKEGENSGEDDIVGKNDKGSGSEWEEDEWQDEGEFAEDEVENDGNLLDGEVRQAKYVMRNITSHVSLIEETAIRRGVKPTGPPIEFATTHLDEYARKFRWPQHVRNLRNADFCQDPSEILEDYEVLPETKQPSTDQGDQDAPKESAFAQVPRPIVALAAEGLRSSLRKRKRPAGSENQEEPSEQNPPASTLLNIARIGGRFGDGFVESLLSANGKALQGIDNGFDYDKRCWTSLPTKKKPIANWRFVLEHVRRTMCRPEDPDAAIYPAMKHETLERITKRLKNLYGHTTQHEEYDMFEATSANSNNSAIEGDNW